MFSLTEGTNSFLYIFSTKIFPLLYTFDLEVPENQNEQKPQLGAIHCDRLIKSRRFSSERCKVTAGPHQAASLMQV